MITLVLWCWMLIGNVGVRPRRDFVGLEQRRRRAARLFSGGTAQAEVARRLGVSRQSASRWYRSWSSSGSKGLKGAGRAGRTPKLNADQLKDVKRALLKGAKAAGYANEVWTLGRVAAVIERVSGLPSYPVHAWRVLHQLGWSCQRPAKRAVERNEEAIARWVCERWPRVKKTPDAGEPGSSSRTSRGSHSPPR